VAKRPFRTSGSVDKYPLSIQDVTLKDRDRTSDGR
jgi:hypothetical protein